MITLKTSTQSHGDWIPELLNQSQPKEADLYLSLISQL